MNPHSHSVPVKHTIHNTLGQCVHVNRHTYGSEHTAHYALHYALCVWGWLDIYTVFVYESD